MCYPEAIRYEVQVGDSFQNEKKKKTKQSIGTDKNDRYSNRAHVLQRY